MTDTPNPSRRSFLKSVASNAAALSVGGAAVAQRGSGSVQALHAATGVHGGGRAVLKIGLVGCGGRGTGAARQALEADKENVLWAVGDAFQDRLDGSIDGLTEALEPSGQQDRIQVPPERRFTGLDCIDKVLDSGIDVILLASPPGFRPMQIEKAVQKGVHVFAEKPVATDAPGLRRVRAACALARAKDLSVVSGLCYRYHDGRRAIVERLQQGAVGDILAIQGNYITGELWLHQRKPEWSELETQLRNWLYYTWLSGDIMAEQHIHTLDMMAWIKRDVYPVRCYSLGGRQKRTETKYGYVFDHFSTVYEWQDGTRGFSYCRQQNNCFRDVNEYVMGTDGTADVFRHEIQGKNPWRAEMKMRDMYQTEHDEMFAAIRKGLRIDNSDYMINSTMMALMGRLAAYTGQEVALAQAWESSEQLMPDDVTWETEPPTPNVAVPGVTRLS